MRVTFGAIVLAGGAARRMGGLDKPGLTVGSATMLDRVLAAVRDAGQIVVAGRERAVCCPVKWVREEPPGGGPVAALAVALPHVHHPVVALLAADLPFVEPMTVSRLVAGLDGRDGCLLVDADGRDQLLLGAWRTAELRARLPADPAGVSLRSVLADLDVSRISLPAQSGPPPWTDCDTPEELLLARVRA